MAGKIKELLSRVLPEVAEDDLDELVTVLSDGGQKEATPFDLLGEIQGEAAGEYEIFLAHAGEGEEKDGLMWYPCIREGSWAVRPGPNGKKVRKRLKVVAGKSKNQLEEIGLEDIVAAFEDDAVENVTIPKTHANETTENTGFIRGLKIAKSEVKKGPNKGKKVPTLFAGYDFTEPDIKGQVKRGTIAGRSCGLLYDYVNTETGKKYPVVLEHVALTNKPWITGMAPFGRKLSEQTELEITAMSFSDEPPESISAELDLAEGTQTVTWSHEDSPNWLRQKVNEILDTARAEKRRSRKSDGAMLVEEVPCYRCVEAKPGKALISSGWGDDADHWVASFEVEDGQVELDEFSKWSAVKKVFVPDDRDPPAKKQEPLSQSRKDLSARERLELAQRERKHRATGEEGRSADSPPSNTTHPRGGEQHMAENEGNGRLQLSEEAQARMDNLAQENERLRERVERLTGNVQGNSVKSYIGELKAMGFTEEKGFGGMLVELEKVLLADDLGEAVVSQSFSEDGKTEVALSVTDAFKRVFGAIKVGEDGKIALGEQATEPAETEEDGETDPAKTESEAGGGGSGETETGTQASQEGGKTKDGKPGAKAAGEEEESLSAADAADKLVEDNEYLAEITGPPVSAGAANGNGKGGDAR